MPEARPTLRSQISSFFFKSYLPGKGLTGTISFQAHIVDFSLSSSPTWNEEFDMGRADPVMMYSSFNKNLSVSFLVVSLYQDDADDNYLQLGRLGMLTYPIHKPNAGYNAPHAMFNIGEFIGGIGIITSLDYHWTGDMPWLGNPPRPLITEVSLGMKILTDPEGNRPKYKGDSAGAITYMGPKAGR